MRSYWARSPESRPFSRCSSRASGQRTARSRNPIQSKADINARAYPLLLSHEHLLLDGFERFGNHGALRDHLLRLGVLALSFGSTLQWVTPSRRRKGSYS
jgi:hypothetical protein